MFSLVRVNAFIHPTKKEIQSAKILSGELIHPTHGRGTSSQLPLKGICDRSLEGNAPAISRFAKVGCLLGGSSQVVIG